MPYWMAPTYQQNQQTTAPCLPKLFASCWENVTSSKPGIAANLSRDYNIMSSKDRPHHNQQAPSPPQISPPVFHTRNWLPSSPPTNPRWRCRQCQYSTHSAQSSEQPSGQPQVQSSSTATRWRPKHDTTTTFPSKSSNR